MRKAQRSFLFFSQLNIQQTPNVTGENNQNQVNDPNDGETEDEAD